jgi:signal transduction histidine kinase/CheY-like chemotaxis protein
VPVSADIREEAGRALAAHSPDGLVILRSPGDWTVAFANDVAEKLLGAGNAREGVCFLDLFAGSARSLIERGLDAAFRTQTMKDVIVPYELDDALFEMRIVPITDAVVLHFRDTSVLALRERQQAAAAALGLRAISGAALEPLFTYGVELIQAALLVDFVYVVELKAPGELVVRAHVGRKDMNPVGRIVLSERSIVSHVIRTGQPIVTANFADETRYDPPPAVAEVAASSAAAVPIRGRSGGFGAIVVMNRAVHEFRPEDVAFLQTAANVLAASVDNARDVAKRISAEEALRHSEEQLQQALKMEAVGRLAGGIAHDFNNLLTAIRGYSDMIANGLRAGDPLKADVEEIQRAADRAASLTHQLLAFSRRQVLRPDRLDVAAIVRDLERMVRRLIGEDIELRVHTDGATRTVLVDRGQIEQVVLNLVINARDAMPAGGSLSIDAHDHDVAVSGGEGTPPPGRYVLIKVEDSGAGIPPDIIDRVFEPFFTTKGPGKGTGLGLSTAYGIVKQSGGFIYVSSHLGRGTTIRIYLPEVETTPAVVAPAVAAPVTATPATVTRGGETILLVEDADAVRHVLRRALAKLGYNVLEASNGPQAIGIAVEQREKIDLVLTDFVMPHMGGRELIDRIYELGIRPRVLIMSGYIDDALLRGGGFPAEAAFIEKPFTADVIGRKVRDVLDGTLSSRSVPSPF